MKYVKSIILLLVMLTAQGAHGQKYDFSSLDRMHDTKEGRALSQFLNRHPAEISMFFDTISWEGERYYPVCDVEIAVIASYAKDTLSDCVTEIVQRLIGSREHFITDVAESEYFVCIVRHIYWYMRDYWDLEHSYEDESMFGRIDRYVSSLPAIVTDSERRELKAALEEYHRYETERLHQSSSPVR